MDKKKCFKCGIEKELSEFYVHKQMGDGHLNKCKDCTKNDVKSKYEVNMESSEYVEKERARGREKYHRLNYKNLDCVKHPEGKDSASFLKRNGIDLSGKEVHHWNYNFKYDVFILSPRAHKLVHKYITFDKESNMFRRNSNGALLDTKEKHFYLIKAAFIKNNVSYEIDVYPNQM